MRIIKNYGIWFISSAVLITIYSSLLPRPMNVAKAPAKPQVQPVQPAKPAQPVKPVAAVPTKQQPQQAATPAAGQGQAMKFGPITKRHEKFTQMEAYLYKPADRKSLVNRYASTALAKLQPVKHMDLVSRVMAAESDLRDTHWAFYHGTTNDWTVWQDTYTALFNHFNPSKAKNGDADFIFLRTSGTGSKSGVKNFLVETLKKDGLVNDTGELKAILLSTNLFLFGNSGVGTGKESTWRYVIEKTSHEKPNRDYYVSIMDEFGLSDKYVDQLIALVDKIENEMKVQRETLLQIFVPKGIVDSVGYLAWSQGIPANKGAISWVTKNQHKFKGQNQGMSSTMLALANLRDQFKNNQDHPLFKEVLQEVEQGSYSLDAYLKKCCNEPGSISNMDGDGLQARLLFTDEFLLNPSSGVKMYRYTGMNHEQMKEYKKSLDAIIKNCISAKK